MLAIRPLLILTAVLPLATAACRHSGEPPADLVFRHGAVYTMDAARSWAGAVAVRGGRIVYVGADTLPPGTIGPKTEVVDLKGEMLLPAFQDAHVHLIDGGVELGDCDLTGAESAAQVAAAVRSYASAHPTLPWIRGSGWQLPYFPDGNPRKELLDSLVPDRPAFLWAADGHSAWANSRALVLAGITRDTPDPANGRIERDPRSREPAGTVRESAAALFDRVLPVHTAAEFAEGLDRAQRLALSLGLTTIFDADVEEPELRGYADADRAGRLHLRVVAALDASGSGDTMLARLRDWRVRYATPHVRPTAVKLYQDGVIEARTAAMLAPYLDRHGDAGQPVRDQATLDALTRALDRDGFQIHVHAIGDRAIRMTLDALERAAMANGPRDRRAGIAHLELIDPADIPRFRQLGVVANFQARWANGDEYLTKMTEPALGPARSRWLYPIASVARTGAVVAGGSDWSVSSLDPLEAIEVGITHREPGDTVTPPWNPAERVDLPTMLALYTINAAWAYHLEGETGSIEVGKLADLIVLDRNLFALPTSRIHEAKVIRTVAKGRTVFRRAEGR
ncbi:MAG: amidohydrolase [Gemmatimonadales bacterium]